VPDARDRRRVLIRPIDGRTAEVARLFTSLGQAMAGLTARHSNRELRIISGFLSDAIRIFEEETRKLSAGPARKTARPAAARRRKS